MANLLNLNIIPEWRRVAKKSAWGKREISIEENQDDNNLI